jgi:hypothetical protein
MTFRCEKTVARPRKEHRCDYCSGSIPAGQSHVSIAGHWDGEFYSARGHHDCIAMWNECYPIYADYGEGMAFALQEAIEDRDDLLAWRGEYPHVICRIELGWQRSDIQWAKLLLDVHRHYLDPDEYLHTGQGG